MIDTQDLIVLRDGQRRLESAVRLRGIVLNDLIEDPDADRETLSRLLETLEDQILGEVPQP